MPIAGACPYYQYEKAGVTYCECAKLKFPDKEARRGFLYAYCAHPRDFERCPFKTVMDGYYERRF